MRVAPGVAASLDSGQSADLAAGIRLPSTSGGTTAQPRGNDQERPGDAYTPTAGALVTDAATVSARLVADLQGLPLRARAQHRDRGGRAPAVGAGEARGKPLPRTRIDELLEAIEDLFKIASIDTSAYRTSIDRLLDEASYRWWLGLP